MGAVLRVSVSLDGRLLQESARPIRSCIPLSALGKTRELVLTIHPLIVGGDIPTLSGFPGDFLPAEQRWEGVSVAGRPDGTIVARYRRKIRVKRVSRTSRREP